MNQLLKSLPHRYPFLLVDKVVEFVPGQHIAGIKNFTIGEEVFAGHLPNSPVVPMGLLLEAVTQLGAILVLERPQMAGKVAVILQIPSARVLRPIQAGETLRLEAQVVKLHDAFGELSGAVYQGTEFVGEGQMRFAITNAADLLGGGGLTSVHP